MVSSLSIGDRKCRLKKSLSYIANCSKKSKPRFAIDKLCQYPERTGVPAGSPRGVVVATGSRRSVDGKTLKYAEEKRRPSLISKERHARSRSSAGPSRRTVLAK